MLSKFQLDVITMLSGSVWIGVIGGALAGILTGGLIVPIRTHKFASVLPGAVYSVLPGIAVAVTVSLILAMLQMVFYEHGDGKTSWYIPDWVMDVHLFSVFAAGVAGAFLAQRYKPRPLSLRVVAALSIAGAILGALAHVISSFDGYFVLESNSKPIEHAIIGSLVGGLVVLFWCIAVYGLQTAERTTSA